MSLRRFALTLALFLIAGSLWAVDDLYQFSATDIDGKAVSLAQFKGKVVLVVNTASKCGYTPQYTALESLYQKYRDRGFVILAFPSNDFLFQEPGSNADIKEFCTGVYNVSFPLFAKIDVVGSETHPLFRWLTDRKTNAHTSGPVTWNFNKFLIGADGKLLARFDSPVDPMSREILNQVERALSQIKS